MMALLSIDVIARFSSTFITGQTRCAVQLLSALTRAKEMANHIKNG